MGRKSKIIVLSTIIVLLGFLRGYLFGNINWIYKTLTVDRPNQARTEFHFLLQWKIADILILKWVLTFVFLILFAFLSWLIIKLIFNNKEYSRRTLLVFAGLLATSFILYVVYYLSGKPDNLYGIIRTIMGTGQSFIPLMILVILFKFLPEKKNVQH